VAVPVLDAVDEDDPLAGVAAGADFVSEDAPAEDVSEVDPESEDLAADFFESVDEDFFLSEAARESVL